VEEAVSKGFSAGCAHEAGGVPRLPQGVHHLLQHRAKHQHEKQYSGEHFKLFLCGVNFQREDEKPC